LRIGAALSTDLDPAKATKEAVEEARVRLGETEVSLAVLVTSRDHAPFAEVASEALLVEVGPERVIGCVAETVVGGDREVEGGPAVAVWLASLPEPVETFHMEFVRTSGGGVFGGYRFEETAPGPCLLIGDPFSFPTDLLLEEPYEHRLLVEVDRQRRIGLRQPHDFVHDGEDGSDRSREGHEVGNVRSERGLGSRGR
jgi:small ligand-binding sensory domain FIST